MRVFAKYSASRVTLAHCGAVVALATGLMAPAGARAQAAGEAPSTALEELVVTAQRRSERLEDVPITVAAFSGDQLAEGNTQGVRDLQTLSPAVRLDMTGTSMLPTIRGVGTLVTGSGQDPNVAIYLDGFYQPSSPGNRFDLNNIAQIEILKGPQGTLFGRNATGGAILIRTAEPSFTPEGKLTASYGRWNDTRANLYVSAPLTSDLAASLSLYGRTDDGYVRNIVNGHRDAAVETWDVRGKLLYRPSEDVKVTLGLIHSDVTDPGGLTHNALNGLSVGVRAGGIASAERGRRAIDRDFPPKLRDISSQVQLTAEADLGWAVLTSRTGWKYESLSAKQELDGSSAFLQRVSIKSTEETSTQELNLAGKTGRLDWLAGLYVYRDVANEDPFQVFIPSGTALLLRSKLETAAEAAFLDATYALSDKLFITAGLRYSTEEKTYTFTVPAAALSRRGKERWDSLTPRLAVRYALDPSASLYGTYTRGFKSGTFNNRATNVLPVEPETIDAFEVGVKQATARTRVNLAAFYYRYKNLQYTSYIFNGSAAIGTLSNAAKSEIYGLEGTFEVAVTDNVNIRAGAGYTHGEYVSFPSNIAYTPTFVNGEFRGNVSSPFDAGGNTMVRTPRFTGNVALTYKQVVGTSTLEYAANLYATSRVYFDASNQFSQGPYALLDARITWALPDEKTRLSVFGKNILDKKYYADQSPNVSFVFANFGLPRSYGIALERRF